MLQDDVDQRLGELIIQDFIGMFAAVQWMFHSWTTCWRRENAPMLDALRLEDKHVIMDILVQRQESLEGTDVLRRDMQEPRCKLSLDLASRIVFDAILGSGEAQSK